MAENTNKEPGVARLEKRIDFFLMVNSALALLVLAIVALAVSFMWDGRKETHVIERLRMEAVLRDARFQASKGVMERSGDAGPLQSIQRTVDGYALEKLRNGHAAGKTPDDVRREVCERLEAEGTPCVP